MIYVLETKCSARYSPGCAPETMPDSAIDSNEKHLRYKRLAQVPRLHRRRMIHRLCSGLICLLLTCTVEAMTPAPGLSVDSEIATAGYYRLRWESGSGPFELQEAADPGFHSATILYRGPDLATVISGKPDGTWYYRVRASLENRHGPWSDPITVSVSHHDLSRAVLFLLLGLCVFAATVLMITRGKETV